MADSFWEGNQISNNTPGVNIPPYWGKPTANIDWCEGNYEFTPYVAEFWNTMSSLVISVYGAYGVWWCIKFRLEKSVFWGYMCMVLTGLGSAAFHGTLLYECQLSDELPMIYGNIFLCYLVFSDHVRSPRLSRVLPVMLTAISVFISVLMFRDPNNPNILQLGYASQVVAIITKSTQIAMRNPKTMRLFIMSMSTYGLAAVCWMIDRFLCKFIQPFQLHAWWHLLAGYGTFYFILFATSYRLSVLHQRRPALRLFFFGMFAYVYPLDHYDHGKKAKQS